MSIMYSLLAQWKTFSSYLFSIGYLGIKNFKFYFKFEILKVQGQAEILNPTLEALYPVLKDILTEIKSVFVDEFIHLG